MTEEYVLELIQELLPDEHVVPRVVLYERLKARVQKDLADTLTSLYKKGEITYQRTINSITIKPK